MTTKAKRKATKKPTHQMPEDIKEFAVALTADRLAFTGTDPRQPLYDRIAELRNEVSRAAVITAEKKDEASSARKYLDLQVAELQAAIAESESDDYQPGLFPAGENGEAVPSEVTFGAADFEKLANSPRT